MILSKCLVCGTIYDKKEIDKPGEDISHGYCFDKCRLVSKRITKDSEKRKKPKN
jgi:rubredoxin